MNIPNPLLLKKESLSRILQRRLCRYLHLFRIQCGILNIEKFFGVEVFGVVCAP